MRRYRLPFCSVIIISAIFFFPQLVNADWMRSYGGDMFDEGNDVIQMSDGGFLVVGSSSSYGAGGLDIWLLRTDENGDVVWSKTYGGTLDDEGKRLIHASDSGYYVFGITQSFGPGSWVLRINEDGNTMWSVVLDREGYVERTSDGGYVVTGEENDDLFLAKYNEDGELSWVRSYGEDNTDEGSCVIERDGGGFLVVGVKGYDNIYLGLAWWIVTDSLGIIEWQDNDKPEGGYDYRSWANHVCKSSEGGYLVTGWFYDVPFIAGLLLERIDQYGYVEWEKTYSIYEETEGNMIQETSEGNYIITGKRTYSSSDWQYDLWLVKINSQGDTAWTKAYGDNYDDWGNSIKETSDGGFIVAGIFGRDPEESESGDLWLIKTDSVGNVDAVAEELKPDSPANWEVVSAVGSQVTLRYSNSPQGFHASVFNASGRKVDELHSAGRSGTITWGERFSPGVYFIRTSSDNPTIIHKVVLIN